MFKMNFALLAILNYFIVYTCAKNQARKFVYTEKFQGLPKISDFRLEEESLPELKDGEILVEAIYLSVEPPYMRSFGEFPPSILGITMVGGQIARIIESKNSAFPKDAPIYASLGWRTHTVFNPNITHDPFTIPPYILPSFGDLPVSLGLGTLGIPGNTAQFGLLEIIKPKAGDILVVSEAAGAVGNLVGQIAKAKGCKVIGIDDSNEKCNWLMKDLGFDYAINYKTESLKDVLRKYAPDGVDCYFDSIGGEVSSIVISQMREFGRIAVASISAYNSRSKLNSTHDHWPQATFLSKQLKMEGFLVQRFWSKWFDGIGRSKLWIDTGRLKYHETIKDGFENIPQAFIDMLQGKIFGKTIVKILV